MEAEAFSQSPDVDQVLAANPAAGRNAQSASTEPRQIWTVEHLGKFLTKAGMAA